MVLNLSHAANTEEDLECYSRTGLEPPVFAINPLIGNIGAPLRTLLADYHDEESRGTESLIEKTHNEFHESKGSSTSTSSNGGVSNCGVVAFATQHDGAVSDPESSSGEIHQVGSSDNV